MSSTTTVMRKVKIATIYPAATGYEIPLGNGTIHLFTNLKAANNFLNLTNQFLTEHAFSVTAIYCELYQKFRSETWHLLDIVGGRQIEKELSLADDTLKNTYELSTRKTGHHLSFIHLTKSLNALERAIIKLRAIEAQRSNTTTLYRLKTLQGQILQIKNSIVDYGKVEAFETVQFFEDTSPYTHRQTVSDLKVTYKKEAV